MVLMVTVLQRSDVYQWLDYKESYNHFNFLQGESVSEGIMQKNLLSLQIAVKGKYPGTKCGLYWATLEQGNNHVQIFWRFFSGVECCSLGFGLFFNYNNNYPCNYYYHVKKRGGAGLGLWGNWLSPCISWLPPGDHPDGQYMLNRRNFHQHCLLPFAAH